MVLLAARAAASRLCPPRKTASPPPSHGAVERVPVAVKSPVSEEDVEAVPFRTSRASPVTAGESAEGGVDVSREVKSSSLGDGEGWAGEEGEEASFLASSPANLAPADTGAGSGGESDAGVAASYGPGSAAEGGHGHGDADEGTWEHARDEEVGAVDASVESLEVSEPDAASGDAAAWDRGSPKGERKHSEGGSVGGACDGQSDEVEEEEQEEEEGGTREEQEQEEKGQGGTREEEQEQERIEEDQEGVSEEQEEEVDRGEGEERGHEEGVDGGDTGTEQSTARASSAAAPVGDAE